MLRAVMLMSLVLVFACPDASATSRENRRRLKTLDQQFTLMQVWHRSAKSESVSASSCTVSAASTSAFRTTNSAHDSGVWSSDSMLR